MPEPADVRALARTPVTLGVVVVVALACSVLASSAVLWALHLRLLRIEERLSKP